MKPEEMRYCSGGEVHLPFHGSTFTGLKFLYNEYGYEAVDEVLTATGQKVYKSIHERLKNGDTSELLCFWRYYLEREKCDFTIHLQEKRMSSYRVRRVGYRCIPAVLRYIILHI